MQSKVDKAQAEAADAKSQVATFTKQIAASNANTSTGANSVSDKSSSSDQSSSSKESISSEGVEDPWVESGTFTTGDSELDSEVKAFCDSIATEDMDFDTAVQNVYTGIAWSEYVERDDAQHPSGKDWRIKFARMYYENSCSGNCYEFAAFLSYCLQYMGYSDAHAEGVAIEFESGSWGDHGIVFLTDKSGSKCICDTARGLDGYMIPENSYNMEIQDFESA